MKAVQVKEVMSPEVISVREDAPFKEIVRTMHRHGVSGVPVLDAEGRLAGIVTEADLLAFEEEQAEPKKPRRFIEWFIHPARLAEIEAWADGVRAADIMTRDVVTVAPETTVRAALKVLLDAGVRRLPVVAPDGTLAGIVSRRDLLSPFLRPDEEIAREVRDEVILDTMWIDPATIRVDVTDGMVRLEGRVEKKSVKEILLELVSRVDGVVAVDAGRLSYELDDRRTRPPRTPWQPGWDEHWLSRR